MSRLDATLADIRKTVLDNRIRHTRWLVVALVPLVAFVAPSPSRPVWIPELLESLGVICLLVCLIGRGWTSIYIAGRKNSELVAIGPFSIVRNPLYVFSFIGVIGIGLISGVVTLLIVSAVIFALYYAMVVRNEEAYLTQIHGTAFAEYRRTVPRWFPNFSLWRDAPLVQVQPRSILIQLRDSSLFFLGFFIFEMFEYMREFGGFSPLLYLP